MSTPMLTLYQQFYKEYTSKYKGDIAILLLVGKFYELYDMIDKQTGEGSNTTKAAAERMNIVLKTEEVRGETVLKAGIPEQSLHKFTQLLTQDGWTVVVIDQKKGVDGSVIDRIPVRILSAGTHFEIATSDRMAIASLYITSSLYGASVVDITTGEAFSFSSASADEILHMFQVYSVKETIVYQSGILTEAMIRTKFGIRGSLHISSRSIPPSFESPVWRENYFAKMFRLKTLMPVSTALFLTGDSILEIALACILQFIEDHFPQKCDSLQCHTVHSPSHFVRVSNNMLEQLNIITQKGQMSILDLVDKTYSSIGKRAMRERILRPITDPSVLEQRWTEIDWILNESTRAGEATIAMRGIGDLPRLHHRISCGTLRVNDVLQLFQSYSNIECLCKELAEGPLSFMSLESVRKYISFFKDTFDETKAIASADGGPNGYLTNKAGPKTYVLEDRIRGTQQLWFLQWSTFCKRHGIDAKFSFRREENGELIFEGPRAAKKQLDIAIQSSPFTNLRIEAKTSGPIIIHCEQLSKIITSCYDLFLELDKCFKEEHLKACDILWEKVSTIQGEWIEWIGRVDCTLALASVSRKMKWTRPILSTESYLDIQGLRHPLLEQMNTQFEYVKHRVQLTDPVHGWLVYGVNASGKSSLMKATGIAVILAQAGCFVPADEMKFRPYTATFSRIWSHDNLWAGLSSFAVEIGELRDILKHANDRSLVLGDEVCSGTESISATALVASTLEELDKRGTHFIFATHLHDLLRVNGFLPRDGIKIWHLRVIREGDKLIYDRRLQEGSGSATYGLEVARAMGLPFSLMERALEIRKGLDREGSVKSVYNKNVFREECAECHCRIVDKLHAHHIEEQAEGGSNHVRNLAVLCDKCHMKHHAGLITVAPYQQTSNGPERVEIPTPEKPAKPIHSHSEEEMKIILTSLNTLKGRPYERIRADLKEKGISITKAQLSKLQAMPSTLSG
jgi:DNA mismatch repair protein MutS